MGALRDRMEDDLRPKGYSVHTQTAYLRCARALAAHFRRSPREMGAVQIRTFLLHLLKAKKASATVIRMHVAAIRFLYCVTLRRPEAVRDVHYPRVPQRLPDVLTAEEVERFLLSIRSIRNRALAMLAYGAGLRVSEACSLEPAGLFDACPRSFHDRSARNLCENTPRSIAWPRRASSSASVASSGLGINRPFFHQEKRMPS